MYSWVCGRSSLKLVLMVRVRHLIAKKAGNAGDYQQHQQASFDNKVG